jgi:hypothetical protein
LIGLSIGTSRTVRKLARCASCSTTEGGQPHVPRPAPPWASDWAYRAMYAWSLAATGREAAARHELATQRAAGAPGSWPRDTNWLSAMKELSEAAVLLGERALGAELETLLGPFGDRMVPSARGLLTMGSVAGALGRLAELRGDARLAADRYAEAIEREEHAGALVWATHHRL